VYDTYGNRALLSTSSDPGTGLAHIMEIPTTSVGSVPFNASTNRWNFSGALYDNGQSGGPGNLTNVQADSNNLFSATYDAENRQVSTSGKVAGVTTTVNYTYDGDGRRIIKNVAGGSTTTYVYDATGNLTAEYSSATNPHTGTLYLTSDHLGSTRLITTPVVPFGVTVASPTSRSDYLAFGQEIPNTTAWNRASYVVDSSQTLKFTSKERDAETGLDFFGARYFSSAQGRFTGPDKPLVDQQPSAPQSWNLYSYVRNNPLRFVDQDGQACRTSTGSNGETIIQDADGNGCAALSQPTVVRPDEPPSDLLLAVAIGTQRAQRDICTSAILIGGFAASYASVTLATGTAAGAALTTIGRGTTLLLPKVADLIASAQRAARSGAQTAATRGLQALQKKIDRGNDAYAGLAKTQAQAEAIIQQVLNSTNQTIQQGVSWNGQAYTDVFDGVSGRGVRIIRGQFDTFVNK
jgi:RHS repeat-associated protein